MPMDSLLRSMNGFQSNWANNRVNRIGNKKRCLPVMQALCLIMERRNV